MFSTFKRAFWILGILITLLVLFLPGYTKLQELRDKNHDLADKMKRLHMDNVLLDEELRRLRDDPVYQEKIAREKLGVVRKGEIPVKIVPQQKKR